MTDQLEFYNNLLTWYGYPEWLGIVQGMDLADALETRLEYIGAMMEIGPVFVAKEGELAKAPTHLTTSWSDPIGP